MTDEQREPRSIWETGWSDEDRAAAWSDWTKAQKSPTFAEFKERQSRQDRKDYAVAIALLVGVLLVYALFGPRDGVGGLEPGECIDRFDMICR